MGSNRRRRTHRHQLAIGSALIVGIVAIAGAAFWYDGRNSEPSNRAAISVDDINPPPVAPYPLAAFLGDSYTAGAGAANGEHYAAKTVQDICWDGRYFGEGGTGYTNRGQPQNNFEPYFDRVDDVIVDRPSVVIVQGSTNDSDGAATKESATNVFINLHNSLPNSTVIALGPLNPPGVDAAKVATSRNAVRAAAAATDTEFIDATGWLTDDLYASDRIHPSPEGHEAIAVKLVEALRHLQPSGAPMCAELPATSR